MIYPIPAVDFPYLQWGKRKEMHIFVLEMNPMRHIIAILLVLAFCLNGHAQNTKRSRRSRLKVGLVLGGGGAKGAAEVGVLKVIEEVGIPIDYVVGTSIGSIVGAAYSCGMTAAEMDSVFSTQKWIALLTDRKHMLPDDTEDSLSVYYLNGQPVGQGNPKRRGRGAHKGAFRGRAVTALFQSVTGQADSIDFDDMPIPFRCVAVDITAGREVVLQSGNLPMAMRASMGIPGIYKPLEVGDSTLLVDGGMLNSLPVDVCRQMGADVIIAVDLTQNKRDFIEKTMRKRKNLIGKLINWNRTRPDLIKYNQNRQDADVYINPHLDGFGAASFTKKKIARMIEIGEEAGRQAKPELEKLRKRIYSKKSKK